MPLNRLRKTFGAITLFLAFGFWSISGFAQTPLMAQGIQHVDSLAPAGATPRQRSASIPRAALQVSAAQVVLGPLVLQETVPDAPAGLLQIGLQRESPSTATSQALAAMLNWKPTAHGGWVAAVQFSAQGAYGLRLGMLVEQLPGSVLLRLYGREASEAFYETAGHNVLQLLQANRDAGDTSEEGRTWWTPDIGGDETTLEIELPPGVSPELLRLSIARVMHIYDDASATAGNRKSRSARVGESDYCNLDSSCYDSYKAQRNAVANMEFIKNGRSYVCTGTLLSDRHDTRTPYFLTANHCISNQTVASTLQTVWFYRSASCGSRNPSPSTAVLRGGATLLYTKSNPDATLLRLNDHAPQGAVFSGWKPNKQAVGTPVVGIHHPAGDLQKISFGSIDGTKACSPFNANGSVSCRPSSTGGYYDVGFRQGIIEGGSSGSGLFVEGLLTGVLSSGNSNLSCRNPHGYAAYARFDLIYPDIARWLEAPPPAPPPSNGRVPVYRLLNTQSGSHLYTISAAERDSVVRNIAQFRYEGVAFFVSPAERPGLSPVYRFFNAGNTAHFYTLSEAEKNYIAASLPSLRYEGPAWYAQTGPAEGALPMYRFVNPVTGVHFFTGNPDERDFVIANNPALQYEGTAYYVWASP